MLEVANMQFINKGATIAPNHAADPIEAQAEWIKM